MKKLMQLLESTVPATISYKGNLPDKVLKVDPSDQETMNNIKTDPNIDHASVGVKKIKEEVNPYEYTKTDSAALGQDVLKVLVDTLKAQGDEIHKTPEGRPDVRLTAGTNRFSIEVNYGDNVNAKNDIFKFTIDPQTSKLMYKLGTNDIPLIKILKTTEGNADSVNKTLLQKNLGVVLKKLKTAPKVNDTQPEPSPEEYDQMAAMEPEHDPSQIGKYIPEITKHVGDKFVNYPKHGGARLGTFNSKKAAEKQLAAIEISKHKNESAKPDYLDFDKDGNRKESMKKALQDKKLAEDLDIGHEDDEPGMLLSDIYGIMQSAKSLYELVSQFKGQQEVDFPHWWQAKIVNAKANLSAARQYLDYEVNKPEQQQVNIAAVALQETKNK